MAASGMGPHDTATLRRIKAGARILGGGPTAHMSYGMDDFLACYRTSQLRWSWFALCQKETLGPFFLVALSPPQRHWWCCGSKVEEALVAWQ